MKKLSKKGVAGLNIFLAVIVMIFMIGLIVMVYTIATDKMMTSLDNTNTISATATNNNTQVILAGGKYNALLSTCASQRNGALTSVTVAVNATNAANVKNNLSIVAPCNVTNTTAFDTVPYLNITYVYTYVVSTRASDIINETANAIGDSSDWFGTFIVLAALVVLILMVVLIVTSIRGTGYVGGGNEGGMLGGPKESA